MGTGYRYAAWQATQNGTTTPGPRPLYYGNIFIATALGGKDKQVVAIANTENIGGYAVYAAGKPRQRAKLEALVLVNMEVYNSTAVPAEKRGSVEFELPLNCQGRKAEVRRLKAAGAEVKEGIAFAGRSVALDGVIEGKEVVEVVRGGKISVGASEAVLISFK